ncbi:MAG: divergent polysaccharide deacetylase family protein [Alphaproteobacteria bacterium]|nr:divergent polysaccharide deacetylase family protein [Alphaproteobacteria bacterium]MDE2110645.1 divergent polysaccharide deacetylase family protein [Alphaproteobacteria bacterium]MDE2495074.1 divergent polysaccharide deacetylase family protein [Alphaproteobacteria bacterium]
MHRLRPIRRHAGPRIDPRTLRGIEVAFWFILALAIGVGGESALSGLPNLGNLFLPKLAAEARDVPPLQFVTLSLPSVAPGSFAPAVLYPVVAHAFPSWMRAPAATEKPAGRLPAIAIVIDDMGNDIGLDRRAMSLPRPISFAFLPYPDETPMLAREGKRDGHEIIVHMPMQAEDGEENPGPKALRLGMTPDEVVQRLDWALSRVPGNIGINNHMGSRFTQNRAALVPVVEALASRHVFFFDSRTTANSQIVPVARAFGVPSASRDVFLDDVQTPEAVSAQLAVLQRDAREHGIAIAIGHPHAVTLDVLSRWCANLKGYRLVPVSVGIRMKTELDMGAVVASLTTGK